MEGTQNKTTHNEAGVLHSVNDWPATIWDDGSRRWYKDGLLHREVGPAVSLAGGTEFWYQNGLPHRLDGPAVTCDGIPKYWYIKGDRCKTEDEFRECARENGVLEEELVVTLLKYKFQ